MIAEAVKVRNDNCLRCKKSRSTWLQNREGFRVYCCWGCADNTGCICERKTHRKNTEKEAIKDPHEGLFRRPRGRPSKNF